MQDMTMSEVLRDPMIRQMLRADRISLGVFAELLETAAKKRAHAFSANGTAAFCAGMRAEQAEIQGKTAS